MKQLTIKEFCYISDGNYSSKYPRSDEFVAKGVPFIRANNLVNGTVIHDDMYYISREKHLELRKGHLQKDDILITTRGNIGQTAVVPPEFHDANINAQIVLLRVNQNVAIPKYVEYALHAESVEQQIISSTTGTALKQLPVGRLEKIRLKLHPLREQQQIVLILAKTDSLIFARKEQLSKLDELVKSRFIEMFGDPISNPQKWDVKSWNDVLMIKNGRNQKQVENANGKYPICGSGGIMGYANDFITHENSVIIGRKGNINKPILMREKFWNVDTAFGLEPNTNILLVDYLYLYCVFFNFEALNKAVTIPSLTKSDLLDIDMPIPPIDLQNEFAIFVEQTDKLKLEIKESLEKLEILKKSLMQKYFG